MDLNNHDQTENNLDLKSFDLGEAGGGTQLIIADKALSATEHVVFTLGNGPKRDDVVEQDAAKEANKVKQFLSTFRMQLGGQKNQMDQAEDDNPKNMKLRCFKLSREEGLEGQKYSVKEFVTLQGIADAARLFGAGQQGQGNPEITQ